MLKVSVIGPKVMSTAGTPVMNDNRRGKTEHSTELIPLTIAVPTYNRRSSVQALVKSICDQAIPGDEVIVSDDGSTDGTSEHCSAVPGVKVIRHDTNQGMVANWNSCLRAATRDWICIIHDDDRLEPGALAVLRYACGLARSPALVLHRYGGSQFQDAFRCCCSAPNSLTVWNCPTIPSGAVVHRTIVDTLGPFDLRFKYSSDLEYFPRIAARFPLIVIESPRVVEYRLHDANYSLQTWRQPDFYNQLEEILRLVISYAEIQDEKLKRDLLDERMAGNLLYILRLADRAGDRDLVRRAGKRCHRLLRWLTTRQKVAACLAAMTGRYPRFPRAKCLDCIRR